MKKSQLFSVFTAFLLVAFMSNANAQCPNCTINLPQMPVDTVYLDSVPDAYQNQYYEEEISFRFPMTTTPLVVLAPGTPSGIALNAFEITGVSGLPLGMTFKLDQPLPARYDQTAPDTRDGCVTLCGTPLQSDSFEIVISIMVETGILAPQSQVIPLTFYVNPDTSAGFTANNVNGCPPLTVDVTNNVTTDSAFGQSATYFWDFGNGTTSVDQNPAPVIYQDSGTYTIDYTAYISTTQELTYLTSVVVNNGTCGDLVGAPELFLTISGANSGTDSITGGGLGNVPSSSFPATFNFGTDIILQAGDTTSIWVQEDDAVFQGLPGPEDCGTVSFPVDTAATTFTLTDGGLTVTVNLNRVTQVTIDTINSQEFVVVQNCVNTELVEAIASSFVVFPNPTDGELRVQFTTPFMANEEVSFRITDMLGRSVLRKELGNFAGQYNESFNLKEFGSGVYVMQLQVGNNLMSKKVIVR